MQTEKFTCHDCKQEFPIQTQGGTGYARDNNDHKICYDCCALRDKAQMRTEGKIVLYLTQKEEDKCTITNWPGTLRFAGGYKKGKHNIARIRYDAWFTFEGENWHGINIGDNDLLRCKKLKG